MSGTARFRPLPGTFRSRSVVPAVAVATVLAATVLTGCSADAAPTGVTLAWADAKYQAIKVSWKDSGAPNRISVVGVLTTSPSYVHYRNADEPNTWEIPASALPTGGNYRIAVAVGTSRSGTTSRAAESPVFDTDGPLRPAAVQARASGKDVLVSWQLVPPGEDFTPGDPLDLPAGRQVYVPVIGQSGRPLRTAGPGTTGTRQMVKNLRPPYLLLLRATNEWSSITAAEISARQSFTSAAVPARGSFSAAVLISGRTVQLEISCLESRCRAQQTTTAGLPIVIQARQPGGAWVAAARGRTTPGGHFQIRVTTSGTRYYRAYAMASNRSTSLSTVSTSTPGLTRGYAQIASASWVGGNVKRRNQTVTAMVTMRPAINGTAIVQFWTGTGWRNLKGAPIAGGRTMLRFRAVSPGAFAYRFLLPTTAYRGAPVYGAATPSLVLRVL